MAERKETPIMVDQLIERQARYDRLIADLIAAGILERGPRDGHKTVCPNCGRDTDVDYRLEPRAVTCNAEQHDKKTGCGETFQLQAATPMHHITWFPLDYSPTCLEPAWHREAGPDHEARAKYRELKLKFLEDIGVVK